MSSQVRQRKQVATLHSTTTTTIETQENGPVGGFHWSLWVLLCIENWVLDFGRPILALYVSVSFPLSLPSIGDYCHLLYNVITALILINLLQRSLTPVPKIMQDLLTIFFVMGASIHLVGDSFSHRLIHCGYQLHLSVRDNPIVKNLSQPCLVNSFELMYFYDEQMGHELWYIPLFGTYLVYFYGCFSNSKVSASSGYSISYFVLLIMSVIYHWYLVTEGQLIEIFLISLFLMFVILIFNMTRQKYIDINGVFLLLLNTATLFLVIAWVSYLWDDPVLRVKYPGLLYVPEPWSYWSLHHF